MLREEMMTSPILVQMILTASTSGGMANASPRKSIKCKFTTKAMLRIFLSIENYSNHKYLNKSSSSSDSRGSRYNNNANGGQRTYNKSSHEEGMVRLRLNVGKEHGIRPNDIVGSIAYHADIPGRTIGAIRIEQSQTMVDVPEKFVSQVLGKSDSYQIHKQPVNIQRA